MATQLKKVVAPSGGDYTSLEACMNANEQNLVTADKYFDVEIDGTWSNADTTVVTIHNYTTDATRYINIYTTSAARHLGVWSTSYYRLTQSNNGDILEILNAFTTVNGLQISNTANYANSVRINSPGSLGIVFKNNIVANSRCQFGGVRTYYTPALIYNNFIYNITRDAAGTGGDGIQVSADDINTNTPLLYNNTILHCVRHGIYGVGVAKNNAVFDVNTGDLSGVCFSGLYSTSDYNLSSDTTGDDTGSNGVISKASANNLTNTGAGTEDLHLKAGADAINVGLDLSASFTTDIDGTTRPTGTGTWDIGADEYVAEEGGETVTPYGYLSTNKGFW